MDKLVIAYQCRPIFSVSRYKSEIRSIQRSEIALKKNRIHHPRVIIRPRFLLPLFCLKTLFSLYLYYCFSRLFFLFHSPNFVQFPKITRFRYPPLIFHFQHERRRKEEREWTTYNRVIYFQPGVTSNRIVTRPIVNNTLKRTFDLSVAKRGKLARRRGPAAIALERPPLSQRLSQTAHNNESFTLEPIRSLLGVRWTTTTLRRAATFTSSRLTYYRRGR